MSNILFKIIMIYPIILTSKYCYDYYYLVLSQIQKFNRNDLRYHCYW